MDRSQYRRLALVAWTPIVVVSAITALQVLAGSPTSLVDLITSQVGETALSTAFWFSVLTGGIALVQSDIGETRC